MKKLDKENGIINGIINDIACIEEVIKILNFRRKVYPNIENSVIFSTSQKICYISKNISEKLKLLDQSNLVQKYECGHIIKPVIINANEFTLSLYLQWKESNTNKCLKCWLKENKICSE